MLCNLLAMVCIGQGNLDSLRTALVQSGTDKVKTSIQLQMADVFFHTQKDSFEKYMVLAHNGLDTSRCNHETVSYLYLKANATVEVYVDFEKARSLSSIGIQCAEDLGDNKRIGQFYMIIGNSYYYAGRYKEAFENSYRALEYFTLAEFKEGKAVVMSTLSVLKSYLEDYDSAIGFAESAYPLLLEVRDTFNAIVALQNLGTFYSEQGQLDSALKVQNDGLMLSRLSRDTTNIAYSLRYIAGIFREKGEVDSALVYLEGSNDLASRQNDLMLKSFNLVLLGQTLIDDAQYQEGIEVMRESEQLAIEMDIKSLFPRIYESLTHAYEATGLYEQAFKSLKMLTITKDSSISLSEVQSMNEISSEYEMRIKDIIAQQEADKAARERSRQIQILMLGVVLVLMVLVVLANFLYRKNTSQKAVDFILLVAVLLFIRFVHLIYDPYAITDNAGSPYFKIIISVVIAIIMGQVHNGLQTLLRRHVVQSKPSESYESMTESGD